MATPADKKLGILVSSPPAKGDLVHVRGLAAAALARGVDVYLYLIDEGTRYYGAPDLDALKAQGLKLYVCAYGGKQRGIEPDAGAVFGGLSALGGILEGCDRFVAFN